MGGAADEDRATINIHNVIPAQAGTQGRKTGLSRLGSRLRGNDTLSKVEMKVLLIFLLRAYQLLLSPFLAMTGGRCRFHPNCSTYAIEALQIHGIKKGAGLSLRRLARCHPWGSGGLDPVPPLNEAG